MWVIQCEIAQKSHKWLMPDGDYYLLLNQGYSPQWVLKQNRNSYPTWTIFSSVTLKSFLALLETREKQKFLIYLKGSFRINQIKLSIKHHVYRSMTDLTPNENTLAHFLSNETFQKTFQTCKQQLIQQLSHKTHLVHEQREIAAFDELYTVWLQILTEQGLDFLIYFIWFFFASLFYQSLLTGFLRDPDISEIMVNGPHHIFLEREGVISQSLLQFWEEEDLRGLIERLLFQVGKKIDLSQPYCDARLPDGSRLHVIMPPLSKQGPCLTIRKFRTRRWTPEDMIQSKAFSEEIWLFLKQTIEQKYNILVSGGTGTGKTTLLNLLGSLIDPRERIIVIEDCQELTLQQPHTISLEARSENSEKTGAVTIEDLLRNALRMRPDRLIIGECRGAEAFFMLQAMNTGHEGSMSTIHASSVHGALHRLEALCLLKDLGLPLITLREQISNTIHIIVQVVRRSTGQRHIQSLHKILPLSKEGHYQTQPIFTWDSYQNSWRSEQICGL